MEEVNILSLSFVGNAEIQSSDSFISFCCFGVCFQVKKISQIVNFFVSSKLFVGFVINEFVHVFLIFIVFFQIKEIWAP